MNRSQCQAETTLWEGLWIWKTHGQLPPPEPFVPHHPFLHYGHNENEDLVQRIKTDLQRRGHGVRFGKNKIKAGYGLGFGDAERVQRRLRVTEVK